MTDETKGDGMTLEQVLAEWVAAGGSHHGPNVETVTMPLSDYVSFRNSHLAAQSAMRVDEAMVEDVARALYVNGWSSGGDYDEDFVPDVRAALQVAIGGQHE